MNFKNLLFYIFTLLAMFFALQSCEKKAKTYPKKKSNLEEINRLIALGEKSSNEYKYDSSYFYFSKAKSLCDVKKDTAKIIYSILKLAYIQQNQGDYSGCENTILEALPFLKNNPKPNHHWAIYNVMGYNYMQTLDYKLALHYNNQALNLKTDAYRKNCIKNNIALVYMDMGEYRRSQKILLPLISHKDILNDSETNSIILDNLGYSLYKTGNLKGINYMNQSLAIRKKNKYYWGLVRSYIHLSEYHRKTNARLANEYAQLAYKNATKVNNAEDRLVTLKIIIRNCNDNHLKKYSLDYIRISDSLTKARQIAKNQFAKIKYDSRLEKEENLKLKTQKAETALELERQKNQNLILSFLVITGILSTIFLYYFFKATNKKEKIQVSYDTESRIAKKLHDELANDVYHTMAFAETQDLSNQQNKETLLHNLDTIYSRTRNISKENSLVDTGTKYAEGLKEMISGFNNQSTSILVNGINTIIWSSLNHNEVI
jgi:hypothetical protein